MKLVLVSLFVAILGSLSALPVVAQGLAQKEKQMSYRPGDLTDLYERQHKLNKVDHFSSTAEKRSYTIFQYIKSCCETPTEVESLLRDNNFQFKTISDPDEISKLNKQLDQSKRVWGERYPDYKHEYYDQIISGNRGPTWWKPWLYLNSTQYTVSIFIKDGKVVWGHAYIDSTLF